MILMLRRNIIANFLGQGWTALMGLAFLPLFIKYLGLEAYGLIGLYAVMQAWFTLLDMGMTPTLNREMARFTAGAHTARSIGDLLRSLEIVCASVALLICTGLWFASSWLASDWLRVERLPVPEVAQAIVVMAWVVALRFVEGLYRGAILGLQRQVWLNGVGAWLATMRWAGAVAVLAWVSPTIGTFFLWQGLISAVTVVLFACFVHRALPRCDSAPRFSSEALAGLWRFAGGMMANTFLALVLTQVDKIVLSRLLSLDAFGRYMFAAAIAGALLQLVTPVSQAYFPHFTELVTHGKLSDLADAYHRGAQLVSVLIMPVTLLMVVFGENLLALWTGNLSLAGDTAPLLGWLAIGTMLNGLMHIPYILQLAHGWSSLAARINLAAVGVLIPAILWAVPRYGAVGAAWAWVALNAGYVFVGVHLMHDRLLRDEKRRWYRVDIARPLVAALCGMAFCWVLHPDELGGFAELGWLLAAGLVSLVVTVTATPTLKWWSRSRVFLWDQKAP
jgi:O-antigen/teichoic acid export membrane protein